MTILWMLLVTAEFVMLLGHMTDGRGSQELMDLPPFL